MSTGNSAGAFAGLRPSEAAQKYLDSLPMPGSLYAPGHPARIVHDLLDELTASVDPKQQRLFGYVRAGTAGRAESEQQSNDIGAWAAANGHEVVPIATDDAGSACAALNGCSE